MKIALGADHAGFRLKEHLRQTLSAAGHEVLDVGTASEDSTDYPDYARKVGRSIQQGEAERGILVCSTGVGMTIAANKMRGIRAGLGINDEEVQLIRAHNNANVLALSQKFTGEADAERYVNTFLTTPFEGGRHERRLNKVAELEKENA